MLLIHVALFALSYTCHAAESSSSSSSVSSQPSSSSLQQNDPREQQWTDYQKKWSNVLQRIANLAQWRLATGKRPAYKNAPAVATVAYPCNYYRSLFDRDIDEKQKYLLETILQTNALRIFKHEMPGDIQLSEEIDPQDLFNFTQILKIIEDRASIVHELSGVSVENLPCTSIKYFIDSWGTPTICNNSAPHYYAAHWDHQFIPCVFAYTNLLCNLRIYNTKMKTIRLFAQDQLTEFQQEHKQLQEYIHQALSTLTKLHNNRYHNHTTQLRTNIDKEFLELRGFLEAYGKNITPLTSSERMNYASKQVDALEEAQKSVEQQEQSFFALHGASSAKELHNKLPQNTLSEFITCQHKKACWYEELGKLGDPSLPQPPLDHPQSLAGCQLYQKFQPLEQ